MIPALWKWLTDNGTALGVIIAAIPILWAGVQFILIKKAENKRVRFTTFHNLIKQLVEPETPDQAMRVDRQVAVVYELRSFKNYYPVTLRILKGLRKDWTAQPPPPHWQRLIEEMDHAIKYIEKKV